MGRGLRIDYLGDSLRLTASALAGEHHARGHTIACAPDLGGVSMATPPDVVLHQPLDRTPDGLVGTCALARLLPAHALLVPMFSDFGSSHAMFVRHALRGNCHPKMLLHWLGCEQRTPCQVLDRVEHAAGLTAGVDFAGSFPPFDVSGPDLGEIMAERERFGRLLYVGAWSQSWSSWGDLTRLLAVGDGVVRNVNSELGRELKRAGIVAESCRWTAQRFTRFVVEHRSFIVAFGQSHLGYEPPADRHWWCTAMGQAS